MLEVDHQIYAPNKMSLTDEIYLFWQPTGIMYTTLSSEWGNTWMIETPTHRDMFHSACYGSTPEEDRSRGGMIGEGSE